MTERGHNSHLSSDKKYNSQREQRAGDISTKAAANAPHSPSHSSKVNYTIEHAPPSLVCSVRKIQNAPYDVLSTEQLYTVTSSNPPSMRPPIHVAHQAVMDFYKVINGNYGVNCPNPSTLELITFSSRSSHANHAGVFNNNIVKGTFLRVSRGGGVVGGEEVGKHLRGTQELNNNNSANNNNNNDNNNVFNANHMGFVNSNQSADAIAKLNYSAISNGIENNNNNGNGILPSPDVSDVAGIIGNGAIYTQAQQQQQQQQQNKVPSVLGTSIIPPTSASSSEDYRLSQIRRNERHVNNSSYGKVCLYYNSREGCRRGPHCNFLHEQKGGNGSIGGSRFSS